MIKNYFTTLFGIAAFLGMTPVGWSQEINLNGIPLKDAIETLARQSDFNFIIGSKLTGPNQPTVTHRWENKSAEEALAELLKEHGLKMVKSSASSVVRITYTNQPAIKVNGDLLGNDTNAVPRMMTMDSTPLAVALTMISNQAKLKIILDPEISKAGQEVSFRWKDITAKQALIALCENFDLALVKDSSTDSVQIKLNQK